MGKLVFPWGLKLCEGFSVIKNDFLQLPLLTSMISNDEQKQLGHSFLRQTLLGVLFIGISYNFFILKSVLFFGQWMCFFKPQLGGRG